MPRKSKLPSQVPERRTWREEDAVSKQIGSRSVTENSAEEEEVSKDKLQRQATGGTVRGGKNETNVDEGKMDATTTFKPIVSNKQVSVRKAFRDQKRQAMEQAGTSAPGISAPEAPAAAEATSFYDMRSQILTRTEAGHAQRRDSALGTAVALPGIDGREVPGGTTSGRLQFADLSSSSIADLPSWLNPESQAAAAAKKKPAVLFEDDSAAAAAAAAPKRSPAAPAEPSPGPRSDRPGSPRRRSMRRRGGVQTWKRP